MKRKGKIKDKEECEKKEECERKKTVQCIGLTTAVLSKINYISLMIDLSRP